MSPHSLVTHAVRRLRVPFVVVLFLLIAFSAFVRADDEEDAPVKVDCTAVTSYPHLKDWDNGNTVDPDVIYLLNLYYSTSSNTDGPVEALTAGMHAALEAHSYTTEPGRTIVVVDIARGSSSEDLIEVYIEEALCRFGDRLFGVLGPFHDNRLRQLLDTKILRNNTLVALGPYTGSSTVRFFWENTYFMRADPIGELYTMLNYIINHELHLRVGFAYVRNRNFGDEELVKTTEYVDRVGSTLVGVYDGDGNTNNVDMESFQKLVDSNPQSIVVYMSPGTHAGNLLKLLLTNEQLKDCKIFVPSFLNFELELAADLIDEERASDSSDTSIPGRNRLLSTSTNYPPYDTSMQHIVVFREDMTNYINAHPGEPYDQPSDMDQHAELGDVLINGWIVGQMVLQICFYESWVRSRESLLQGIFRQNRYIIEEDFVLGDYGGTCRSAQVSLQGAVCECNQGGSTVFLMQHYVNESQLIVPDWVFTYSNDLCYAANVTLPAPVNMITINFNGNAQFERIDEQLRVPGQLAVDSLDVLRVGSAAESYNIRAMHTSIDTAQHELEEYMSNQRVDIIIGPVLLGTDTADTLILSPTYRKPHVTFTDPNKVVLRPTLEQQFYLAMAFLADPSSRHAFSTGDQIWVVMRDVDASETEDITTVTTKTAETFRHKKPKTTIMTATQSLDDVLQHNVVTFLMGLHDGDAVQLVHYLERSPKSFVLLLFQDLMMYYDELVEAFNATTDDVRGRLVFSSSFPMWTDDSDAAHEQYPILKAFHEAMGGDTQYYTPRAFEVYVTARLVQALASSVQTINAAALREQLYHTSNFFIDDFRLGPFSDDCDTSGDKKCEVHNYGANEISIVSIRRILAPSQHKVFGPMTPAMTYSKRPLSTGDIIAIAVCGSIALILMIVLPIVICMCCCSNSRDNKNAPKSAEDPVTIIFTDIESSTALWGTVPQIMPDAVATHHKIIRETIAAHKSYEVKTVGDSFMIACKKPFAAVQIAQDIQKRFLAHDWEEDIDECYRQFEQRKAADPDNEDYKPPSANLVRDVYDALWHGLRVRIGVHTGLSDIRQDEITGGFDYYGETSNMAARTEAIGNGGQVLLTDATWWALSQDERDSLDVTNLGRQGLRGVGYPVEMFQLNAVASRTFAALRLDVDAYLPNDNESEGGSLSTDALGSSVATLTGPAAAIAAVLTNCFSPYPPPRRIKELLPLLQKWGIPVPPRHRRVAEEDYCQGLLNRLALKMSSVVQIRSKMDGTAGSAPLGASSSNAIRSRDSHAASVSMPTVNPLDVTTALNSQAVARLVRRADSRRGSRRPSGNVGRNPITFFSPLTSPARSPARTRANSSVVNMVEMHDVFATSATSQLHDHDEGRPLSPLSLARPTPRRRPMAVAAHSMTSETFQSIHITLPGHLQ